MSKVQQEIPIFGKLYQLIESAGQDHKRMNKYVIQEGILYRKKITKTNLSLQLCLPQSHIPQILASYHDHIIIGHLGQNRTLGR